MAENVIPDSVDDLQVDVDRVMDAIGREIESLARENDRDALGRIAALADRVATQAQWIAVGVRLVRTQLPVEDE